MARREYQGGAVASTITGGITSGSGTATLSTVTGWPTSSFSAVLDKGLSGEEKVLATRSGTTITFTTRGYDGTTATSHSANATISPCSTAIDFDEANTLVSGITAGTGIAMAGSTSGSTLLKSTAVAGSTTVTIPAVTDTLVGKATTDTLTNKTLTNPIIPNLAPGYATTATAADTTTLTVSDNRQQRFTGTTTQTVLLPVTSTLPATGYQFVIQNKSTGIVTVQSSGANTIYAVPAGATATFTCILLTGTTAASWEYDWSGATTAPGGSINTGYAYTSSLENTTSTSYTGLTTATAVTVTTGTKALVCIKAAMGSEALSSVWAHVSFAISGATTVAASDEFSIEQYSAVTSQWITGVGACFVVTGLTAGSNTFTMQYSRNGGGGANAYFYRRSISVENLGS